ncbi:type IV conjugative transfer system protein TraL [Glaesserella parasuis]|nr:type IV conjugative transfer system protein TraL [Glaesserella parasuis 174]MCT8756547.1 type IV conjugative transfer system protein TraL [Glaesserella parasuis]MDD2170362.1 type IV conjugative transfer system protein TraL [Glaesserella parasuis]MDO9767926.1 type IV conjugative transfer system protein TraL [Glaesserella parasuis]MDO9922501.1 type IV conjugative transfer system protein TraL [Glaesserella parasuis]
MSGNSREKYRFPTTLSAPERWFGLPTDEAIICVPQALLAALYQPYVFFPTLFISFFLIRRLKNGKGSSYLLGVMYWFLPQSVSALFIRALPASYLRYWVS